MPYRVYVAIAFLLAVVATVVGWSQSLIYKDTPQVPLALWFPLVVISRLEALGVVVISLIQFPLFATAFAIGIRSWPLARVATVLALSYTFLAVVALVMVRNW